MSGALEVRDSARRRCNAPCMWLRRVALLVPLLGCDAFSGAEEPAAAPADGGPPADAAPADAGSAPDAAADGSVTTAGVVPGGDFEGSGEGCGPGWRTTLGSLKFVPGGVSGASACRFCYDGQFAGTDVSLVAPVVATSSGARYVANVSARVASGAVRTVNLEAKWGAGAPTVAASGSTPGSQWGPLRELVVAVPTGESSFELSVHAQFEPASCLDIDALTLVPR